AAGTRRGSAGPSDRTPRPGAVPLCALDQQPRAQSAARPGLGSRGAGHAYFRWIGPATTAQFQAFAGCSATDARAACEAAHVVSIGDDLLLPDEQLEAWQAFEAPSQADYRLVASLDSHLLLRRELRSLLEPVDAERMAAGEFGPVPSGHLLDLHSHAILDRGRIVGLWEFDPAKSEIVWYSFVKPDDALRHAVANTQEFVREVGDARSFSLDSPKSRTNKIELLRSLSAT
ncbi:MAG: winged helix DNA-binding domain-containing protein, partial [Nitrospirae bacterium]|nr:winged helix DNA-binding domain-containing protein [Fimbriimonadaceae bacterium]